MSLTARACWIKAARFDTRSVLLPSGINFFFWCLRYWTRNTWPLLNSVDVFFTQEISNFNKRPILLNNDANGEVSYAQISSWNKPGITPLIMLCAWLQIVPKVASSFLFLHSLSAQSPFFFFWRRLLYSIQRLVVSRRHCSDFMQPQHICNYISQVRVMWERSDESVGFRYRKKQGLFNMKILIEKNETCDPNSQHT